MGITVEMLSIDLSNYCSKDDFCCDPIANILQGEYSA